MIPAGGVGTRLWPLSRASAPKFLHDLTGSGSTLIRATYDRLVPLAGDRIMVVTGRAHRGAVVAQLPELCDEDLVLEPEPRDSAAAIGLAAAILSLRDPEIIMGSFAADQVIEPVEVFQAALGEAIHTAASGKIVTIGIHPTHPSTGFGYIKTGEQLDVASAPSARGVVEFVEKPDEDTARRYLASGGFLWNAGMFVAPVGLMLKHLQANEPQLHEGLMKIAQAWDTEARDEMLTRTHTDDAPWWIVHTDKKPKARSNIIRHLLKCLAPAEIADDVPAPDPDILFRFEPAVLKDGRLER